MKLVPLLKEKDFSDLEPSELILVLVYDSLINNNDSANNVESTERLLRVIVNREEEKIIKKPFIASYDKFECTCYRFIRNSYWHNKHFKAYQQLRN